MRMSYVIVNDPLPPTKVCNFTMTCETESDLRSWRFHTHSHVSEKRSSLFAVECNCPGVDLSNSNTKAS